MVGKAHQQEVVSERNVQIHLNPNEMQLVCRLALLCPEPPSQYSATINLWPEILKFLIRGASTEACLI